MLRYRDLRQLNPCHLLLSRVLKHLRRWLTKSGYNVTFIRNVTDIDDKILHKAVHEEMPWWAVAMKYERAFADAYAALNVMPPTYEPRATGHVTQMIELMQKLIERGAAYAPGNGDVYLEVRKLTSYLTLSRQKLDDLQPSRIASDAAKSLRSRAAVRCSRASLIVPSNAADRSAAPDCAKTESNGSHPNVFHRICYLLDFTSAAGGSLTFSYTLIPCFM